MIKALTILILTIATTEAAIMTLLSVIGEQYIGPWIPAFFDATAVSLVAIITINRMLKHSLISLRVSDSGEIMQLKIGIIVFTFEAIVMLVLNIMPIELSGIQAGLFDVLALTLGSSLVIYGIVLKPAENDFNNVEPAHRFDSTVATNSLGYLCLMILLLMTLIATYEQQLQQRTVDIRQQEASELELIKRSMLNELTHATRDLLIMVNQQAIKQPMSHEQHHFNALQKDYSKVVAIKHYYAQLRILDNNGHELIRLHQDSNHQIHTTPKEQLQYKGDRYYFKDSIQHAHGEIYISPLDLNKEHGMIEQPFNPVIRLATPINDDQGNKTGVLLLNLKGQHLLNILDHARDAITGNLMMLNEDGYWLFGGKPENRWAFMFEAKSAQRFQASHPDVWEKIAHMDQGTVLSDQGAYIINTIEFDGHSVLEDAAQDAHKMEKHLRHWPSWKLVSHIPTNQIAAQMSHVRDQMIILYISIMMIVAIGTATLTQAMLKRRNAEKNIRQLAFYDPLTNLTNRRLLNEKMTLEMAHSRREKTALALMYLDLDHFKPINDELGHDAGDIILKDVADRLKKCMRDGDTIARIGGDEFAALLPKPGTKDDIAHIAERIIKSLSEDFHPLGHTRSLGVSIGIGLLAEDDTTLTLMQRADRAMYEAKNAGRNDFRFSDT